MPARGLGLGQASVQGCVVVTVAALSKAHSGDGIDFNEEENVRRCKQGVSLFFQHCNSNTNTNRATASSGNSTRSKNKNKAGATPSSHPLHPALVNAALQVCSLFFGLIN